MQMKGATQTLLLHPLSLTIQFQEVCAPDADATFYEKYIWANQPPWSKLKIADMQIF